MGLPEPGSSAPPIPGVDFGAGPRLVYFYKTDCPACQVAGPAVTRIARAYPGSVVAVGQDPPSELERFARAHGQDVPFIADERPYPVSEAYDLVSTPTAVLVETGGRVAEVLESWDRDRYNDLSRRLSELAGAPYVPAVGPGDPVPPFRPG